MDNSIKAALTFLESGHRPVITLKPDDDSLGIITDLQWKAIHEAAAILSFAGFNPVVTKWITVSPEAIELIKKS